MTPNAGAAGTAPAAALPRISVIVPSYNSGAYLREALASALDQSPPPHEVLVQDGGSTDGTIDILRSFGERVAWVSAPDGGQSDALNKALARSSGDVIVWLNADDVILPGAFAAATAAFSVDPSLQFVYGDFEIIDGTGALIRSYRSNEYSWDRVYSRGCYIFSGSLFIRRKALVDLGRYDASLQACMDLDLLLRLGDAGPSAHLGRTIAQFRMHSASKSSTIAWAFLCEGFRVRRRWARGSLRLGLVGARQVAIGVVMSATAPLRYSPRWPRNGGSKTL